MRGRYEWLGREIARIPRKKFFVFEQRSLSALTRIESQYGPLPSDYLEFVRNFGEAKLFRSVHSLGYQLMVWAPPTVMEPNLAKPDSLDVVRVHLGHQINTGYAWLEWANGAFVENGAIFVGFAGKRKRMAGSFEEWLTVCFSASRKLYSKREWALLSAPALPFSEREQCIVDAIPRFSFKKAGVTSEGNLLVEVANGSSQMLPYLTVGIRDKSGMTGSTALSLGGIGPGEIRVVEQAVYKNVMNPWEVELFSLPIPDPEDRSYYKELQQTSKDG